MIMALLLVALSQSEPLNQADKEALCFGISDLSVATIEAHEAGVPLQKVLFIIDNTGFPKEVVSVLRKGALKQYSQPAKGIKVDRKLLIDQFSAECLLNEFAE